MSDPISSKEALHNLNAIKDTIDRTTGAQVLCHFIFSMWSLMIVSGLSILIACAITYHLIATQGLSKNLKLSIIIMWVALMVILGCLKARVMYRKGKTIGLTFKEYSKKVINKSFLMIDIPIELMAIIYIIFFLKIGHPEYILTGSLMWIGVLLTLLGAAFFEGSFTITGYIFIICGGFGLLFMNNHLLLFTAINFGVLPIVLGFLMHKRYTRLSVSDHQKAID